MKILYICYNNPFGNSGGGTMASHAYLRACCDVADGQLDLICSSALEGTYDGSMNIKKIYYAPDRSKLQRIMSPITGYMNRYVDYVKKILKKHKDLYEIIVFDHSSIAGTLVEYVNKLGLKTVTIHHNYEKEYFEDNYHGIYKAIFLPHVIRWEKLAYRYSSLNLFLTAQDMKTFFNVYGYSNGVNNLIGAYEFYDYTDNSIMNVRSPELPLTFVITGSLCDYQTIDAIKYFFAELYCYLPIGCKVLIAGRNPDIVVQTLCSTHSNVELISNPTNMNSVLANADVYLCTTRLGGGLKLRVMDGLKNGLPVITHSCSSRGFDVFYGLNIFKVFSNPEEFRNSIIEIISDIDKGVMDRLAVKRIYKENFSYDAGLNRMRTIFKQTFDLV